MRQTGHRNLKMLEVYAREFAPLVGNAVLRLDYEQPAMSAVTGKVLSVNTQAEYAADWALFTDWCTAINRVALPTDWATVAAFTAGCPRAPATVRLRLAAIASNHRAAGHTPPVDPARELIDPARSMC